MKKFFTLILFIALAIGCASTPPTQEKDHEENTPADRADPVVNEDKGPYIIYGSDWAYKLYAFNGWSFYWEDAYKYKVNAYYTRDGKPYSKSETIMAFYLVKGEKTDLKEVVNDDVEYYFDKYPGIKISEFIFDDLNFEKYKKEGFPVVNEGKSYIAVKYDFTDAEGKHSDKYDYVVFFKIKPDSPNICILQLSTMTDEGKKYLNDLKLLYMTVDSVNKADL